MPYLCGCAAEFLSLARSDHAMILSNCRVILADAIRDDLEVVVEEGKIADLRSRRSESEAIDLRGNFLAPGFVDVHIHGAFGRDTMEANESAFRAICDYHAGGGTTSLLLTTVTSPFPRILSVLKAVRGSRSKIPQVLGVHLEGPFISPERAGAQDAEFICEPATAEIEQLLEYRDIVKRVTIAPEIKGARNAIAAFVANGVRVSGGHSNAWEEQARAAFESGMRSVTHTFNCMSSARRRGLHRIAGLLEFAMSEPGISCELIADGHHVSGRLMKLLFCAKGSAGISLVTDATAGAGLAEGTVFSLGGKKCVVEGGVCLLADRSALAGSASRMIDLVRTIVRDVTVSLPDAFAMASRNPAREMGLTHKGQVAPGYDADLVVVSPALQIEQTFVGGECVYCAAS